MAKTVEQLLRKRKFTGTEIGQAYLMNLAAERKAQRENKQFKPLFTRADLDKMQESIQTAEQYTQYLCYANIYSSLVDAHNMTESNIQQFYNGFYRYLYTVQNCTEADLTLQAATNYPLIMTQSQYDRIKAEVTADRESFNTSYYSLLIELVEYYANNPDKAPAAVKKAIKATEKEPFTNERILSHYNDVLGLGYYEIDATGERSDKMNNEEWQEALQAQYMKAHKLTINGTEASPEDTMQHYSQKEILRSYELLYGGIETLEKISTEKGLNVDKKHLEKVLEHIEDNAKSLGDAKVKQTASIILENEQDCCTWHEETAPPTGITKHDVLMEFDLMCLYKGGLAEYDKDLELGEQYKEFITDYPALYKAVKAEIDKKLKRAADLKEEEYIQPLFTYGEISKSGLALNDAFLYELSDSDIIDYYCNPDTTAALTKRKRVMYNGIAILHESYFPPMKKHIAENGDYIEPESSYSILESIDSITDDEERETDILLYRNHLAIPALRFIYAYNALIDIIAAIYDVDCIKDLKAETAYIQDRVEALNGSIYMFYGTVYGTKEEKARKRALIKQVFQPIEIGELQPEQAAVEAIKEQLNKEFLTRKGATTLKGFLPLIEKLMERGL